MSVDTTEDMFGDQIDASVDQVLANIDELCHHQPHVLNTRRMIEFYELHSNVLEKVAGITGKQNQEITIALVATISNYFGGMSFYLPQNEKLKLFLRDIQIYKDFNGYNIKELTKKYDVSQQTIYTAIAKQRDARQKKLPL